MSITGYRYRLYRQDLPGKPDLVFSARRKVISVHGCFWHRHPDAHCKLAWIFGDRSWRAIGCEILKIRKGWPRTDGKCWYCGNVSCATLPILGKESWVFWKMNKIKAIELFAGAGGLGIGVSRSGFETVAVIEWDRYCCDTIRENQIRGMEPVCAWPLIEGDVREFDFRYFEGKVDFVSGGPPCQPFSLGGKHRGHGDHRNMFPEAVRAVREIRPRAFLFENVKGLTRIGFASYFEYIRLQLTYPEITRRAGEDWPDHLARLERHHTHSGSSGLQYRLVTRVLNAADYGVPQRRERVFLAGFRSDLDIEWAFPEPTHSREALIWEQTRSGTYWGRHEIPNPGRKLPEPIGSQAERLKEKPVLAPWRTVRDATFDLPDPERNPLAAASYPNHRFQGGARSYPGHTGSPLDEPAKTLKAGVHGVPGGENMLLKSDGSVRYLTVRESARLQMFPDNFVFHGSWTETMRQLGNAVPVGLAELLANHVRKHLERLS